MELNIFRLPHLLFALAMIAFGTMHFLYHDFLTSLAPITADFPNRESGIPLTGSLFMLTGACIALDLQKLLGSLILGLLFLLWVILLHVPKIIENPFNGAEWTLVCEVIAMGAGALIIARTSADNTPLKVVLNKVLQSSHIVFAFTLIIFGIQHFMYAPFVATLIPSWIPLPLFWAYFIGIIFFTSAASIILNYKTELTTSLLGTMFLLFVVFVHVPRILTTPGIKDEWTSLFIALSMCGISFVLAGEKVKLLKLKII